MLQIYENFALFCFFLVLSNVGPYVPSSRLLSSKRFHSVKKLLLFSTTESILQVPNTLQHSPTFADSLQNAPMLFHISFTHISTSPLIVGNSSSLLCHKTLQCSLKLTHAFWWSAILTEALILSDHLFVSPSLLYSSMPSGSVTTLLNTCYKFAIIINIRA